MAPKPNLIHSILYLSPATTADGYSLENKMTVFQISSSQHFQYYSHQRSSGSHVFHGRIMTTNDQTTKMWCNWPLITSRYQVLQNYAKMGKFRSSAQNSAFRGELWSLTEMIFCARNVWEHISLLIPQRLECFDVVGWATQRTVSPSGTSASEPHRISS